MARSWRAGSPKNKTSMFWLYISLKFHKRKADVLYNLHILSNIFRSPRLKDIPCVHSIRCVYYLHNRLWVDQLRSLLGWSIQSPWQPRKATTILQVHRVDWEHQWPVLANFSVKMIVAIVVAKQLRNLKIRLAEDIRHGNIIISWKFQPDRW